MNIKSQMGSGGIILERCLEDDSLDTARSSRTPSETLLRSVLNSYERGQTMDALKLAEEFAPLKDWAGVIGCSLAARIAANTGGNRLVGTSVDLN
jgi:hypothetical protein